MKRTISASVFVLMLVLVGNAAGWTNRGISNPSSPGSVSYDAGEFFRVDGRRIRLLRSLQKVAIRHVPSQGPAIMRSLSATREPKRPYRVDHEVRELGITILQTEKLESLNELDECIYQLERRPDIERAVPVYIHEESGLEVICTDQFIVKLAAGATLAELDAINKRMGATVVRRLRGATDQFILALPHCTVEELLTMCEVYWQEPEIEWAEPDFLGQVVKRNVDPNDPLYWRQWYLYNSGQSGGKPGADINAPQTWDTTKGSDQIIIAILDDGVDLEHEDLKQNIASNPKEQPGDANGDGRPGVTGVDDDGDGLIDEDSMGREPGDFGYTNDLVNDDDENGYIDDYNGWNFYDNDNDPSPVDVSDNHGTTVAGVAAAKGNNGIGIAGIAFDCKLMSVKVIKGDYLIGNIWTGYFELAEAIRYAAGISEDGRGRWRGADVLNISLGLPETNLVNNALTAANTQGRSGKGCPIFCAIAQEDVSGYIVVDSGPVSGASQGWWSWVVSYHKDNANTAGDDTVWMSEFANADGSVHRFDSKTPPPGWDLEPFVGNPGWFIEDDPSHAYGTSRYQVRPAIINHDKEAYIMAPEFYVSDSTVPGIRFNLWQSCEVNDTVNLYLWSHSDNGLYGPQITFDGAVENTSPLLGYPESHPATIAVGASTCFDYRADYSSYGAGLDFVAPGNDIWTTDRMGGAGYANENDDPCNYVANMGTSYASPLAAGVAALMLSENPNLTADEVRSIMQQTCRQIGGVVYDANGWNEYYGYGCIDDGAAVGALRTVVFEDTFPSTTIDPSKWTVVQGATIDDLGIKEPSGEYSLRLNRDDSVESRVIDLSSYSGAILTYHYERTGRGYSPERGDDLIIDYNDGSNWIPLPDGSQPGDGPDMTNYEEITIHLPSEALHSQFRLRFKTSCDSLNDDWFVDDVKIKVKVTDGALPNVLICGANDDDKLLDIQQKLLGTGQFVAVDILNVHNVTPTLEELQAFDSVLVYRSLGYQDATALGNVMADYVDSGGGVVCMMFEVGLDDSYGTMMQGRWSSEEYYAIPRGDHENGPRATLGTVHDPGHPIMQGVLSFDGGSSSYRPSTYNITLGSVRVADWSDGRPLVVAKTIGSTRRVDLAFNPLSSDVLSNSWDSSTDGALLMANALTWVARVTADTMMPLPEFDKTYSVSTVTRGYWFEAPTNFRITGLRVPDESGNGRQNVEVVRFDNQTPPPIYNNTTNAFVSLIRFVNEPSDNILSVNISVSTGDVIGILGAAGTNTMHNSYGSSDFVSNIGGRSVTLKRMGMQLNLYENHARNLFQSAKEIGRVEMWYIVD